MGDKEDETETDIVKIISREIIEYEEKYGFAELFDSGDESKISIEQNIVNSNKKIGEEVIDSEDEKEEEVQKDEKSKK